MANWPSADENKMDITPDYKSAVEAARKEYMAQEQKRIAGLIRQIMGEVGSLRDQREKKQYELEQLEKRLGVAEGRLKRVSDEDWTVLREVMPEKVIVKPETRHDA